MIVEPGQIWLMRKDGKYNRGGVEFAYLICSTDDIYNNEDVWACKTFMDWQYGASDRMMSFSEINTMEYVGHIRDLKTEDKL